MDSDDIQITYNTAHHSPHINLKDKYNLCAILCFLIGAGQLIPWNFFINAHDYFSYKLRNTSSNNSDFNDPDGLSILQKDYELVVSICSMVPNVLAITLQLYLQQYKVSFNLRYHGNVVLLVIVFVFTTVLTNVNMDQIQITFFILTMISAALLNVATAFIQGSFFGVMAYFPFKYAAAVMQGQALGGIFGALINILVLSVAPSPEACGLLYFLSALIYSTCMSGFYVLLDNSEFGHFYLHIGDEDNVPYSKIVNTNSILEIRDASSVDDTDEALCDTQKSNISYMDLFSHICKPAIGVLITFTITLSVFPNIMSKLTSVSRNEHNPWTYKYFTPVVCFLFFNLSDYIGRVIAGVVKQPSFTKPNLLLIMCISRIFLPPLLLFCNIKPRTHDFIPALLDNSDFWSMAMVWIIGLTGGYCGTLCMMYGPSYIESNMNKDAAGSIMGIFLTLGLGLGVLCAAPLNYIL